MMEDENNLRLRKTVRGSGLLPAIIEPGKALPQQQLFTVGAGFCPRYSSRNLLQTGQCRAIEMRNPIFKSAKKCGGLNSRQYQNPNFKNVSIIWSLEHLNLFSISILGFRI